MIAIVPPNIVLPTPSWAPPSTRMSTPQTLNAPRPEPPIEPPLKCRSATESIVAGGEESGRKIRARESAPASSVPSTRSFAFTARAYSCETRPTRLVALTPSTAPVEGVNATSRVGRVSHEYARAVNANDRVLGTELAGALSRARIFRPDSSPPATMDSVADLHFNGGSIGGSGLGAF